jgi:predicted acyl esterase
MTGKSVATSQGPDNGGVSRNGEGLAPRGRTRRRWALDAAIARIFKMRAGHHDYTLTQAVRVPMRDGVELLTDIYAPLARSLPSVEVRKSQTSLTG